ncbi:hypothetical protein EST38_g2299 [Candolleomyces aberdarensis]|uniref:(4-O-methyl)-D-glucuronate--lignin esterase n=1 Tax=Candolleomyces aberdarensis TaxID=2316362 RepID=A0A4Q2DWE0_9AGAR|nr:hypothetical protein EST38_g2299 [Candolleomyces aberdarensis]
MGFVKGLLTSLLLALPVLGQNCRAPENIPTTNVTRLNDPFTFVDGRRVRNPADWFCRREEIVDLFYRYELGTLPAQPDVSGSLSGNTFTVRVSANGQTINFPVTITYPQGEQGPFPAIIALGGSTVPQPAGVALLTFDNNAIASSSTRGTGLFFNLYGSGHPAGATAIWGWAVSRIIDALIPNQATTRIDFGRLAVTGCSANGRGALVAGAIDQRIVLTIPVESGAGGAGCWRISDDMVKNGVGTQTAAELAQTPLYATYFQYFANQTSQLPFDHHMLSALVAPRGLLVLDNTGLQFLGPQSVYGCTTTARKVFQALDISDRLGLSQVSHTDHCQFPGPQYPEFQAFINKFLRGATGENTNVVKTDSPNNSGYEEPRWVDWTTPRLNEAEQPPQPPNTGACGALPDPLPLRSIPQLPDPFTFLNTNPVRTRDDWFCRRQEISSLFQVLELGVIPPKPEYVGGSLIGTNLTVEARQNGRSVSFSARVDLPSGTGPFPAIIAIGGSSIPIPAGVAVITFPNDDIAEQVDTTSRGKGIFYNLYGTSHSASALAAWTWGVSRVIDVLQTIEGSRIDLGRLAVTGCSRNGKGALVVGAFEQRISLTIPQESGTGGAGCWRIADSLSTLGVQTQTARSIVTENVWFSTLFNNYASRVNDLPIDHHLLAAMIAPRALFVIENTQMDWLGPRSVYGCIRTAAKVFQALNFTDRIGFSQVGGHAHCQFPESQRADLNAYLNKFLLRDLTTNTAIFRTDSADQNGYVENTWVNWGIPRLSNASVPPPAGNACPPLPANITPKKTSFLPNPFVFVDNARSVSNANEWFCRREELSQLFQRYQLGSLPPNPTNITGSVSGPILSVYVAYEGRNISFFPTITYPPGNSPGPFPAIIAVGGSTIPQPADVAIVTFAAEEVARTNGTRGTGRFYDLYGRNHNASALLAQAWGVSRVIDAIQRTPSSRISPGAIGVTGCSDNGRVALVAGAFDPRISLTIPVESGTGGSGCFRIAQDLASTGTITASQLVSQGPIFSTNFTEYAPADKLAELPLDQHLLAAMVAPRGLLVLDNGAFPWLGQQSVFGCMRTASRVFEALGYPDRMGISQVSHTDHCQFPGQQYPELQGYVNKFLRNNLQQNTTLIKTDLPNNAGFDEEKWLDWIVPRLYTGNAPGQPPNQGRKKGIDL